MLIKKLKSIRFHASVDLPTKGAPIRTTYLQENDVRLPGLQILLIDSDVFQITADNCTQVVCTTVANVPQFEPYERFTIEDGVRDGDVTGAQGRPDKAYQSGKGTGSTANSPQRPI